MRAGPALGAEPSAAVAPDGRVRDPEALAERELPVGRGYYRTPVHRQPAVADATELPATEEAARTNFALPMGTDLGEEQVRQVVEECASGST